MEGVGGLCPFRSSFPPDFMFQLSKEEFANLKSQIAISSWGGLRRARAIPPVVA